MNPSVILSFRVKVNSPLYKWLESKSHGDKSMSVVVRDIMDYHRLNNLQEAHLAAIKRNAMLWSSIQDFVREKTDGRPFLGMRNFSDLFWSEFWHWIKANQGD